MTPFKDFDLLLTNGPLIMELTSSNCFLYLLLVETVYKLRFISFNGNSKQWEPKNVLETYIAQICFKVRT